jgi:hypothetical protein
MVMTAVASRLRLLSSAPGVELAMGSVAGSAGDVVGELVAEAEADGLTRWVEDGCVLALGFSPAVHPDTHPIATASAVAESTRDRFLIAIA